MEKKPKFSVYIPSLYMRGGERLGVRWYASHRDASVECAKVAKSIGGAPSDLLHALEQYDGVGEFSWHSSSDTLASYVVICGIRKIDIY